MPLTAEERAALKKSVESATKPKPRLTPLSESEGRALDKANGILPATARDETVEKSFGFAHFGEFLHEVKKSPNKSQPSERLAKAFGHDTVMKAAAGMGELIGSDGGFLVPPEFSNKIFERMYTENNLLGKTDQYTAAGNQMVFPRNNESSRATGSRWGGVRAYWVQEGDTITASAPTFGRLTVNLQKLACIARVTEELLQDSATSMPTYLTRVFASEIGFAANNAVFRGTGAGQPLGLLNGACAVTVSKEAGQAAATITSQNVAKMWARRFALGPTGGYVWLVNQDVLPQLYLMTLGIGTAGVTTFMPPGGLSGAPYASLMGAPVMEVEFASTLGTVGDIALVDLTQIVSVTKGGMQSTASMHVYFTTDEQAFRTTYRLGAAPWQHSALTPFQGTNTQSPIVLLESRA
jgi:HK97 family phage major capsid protein